MNNYFNEKFGILVGFVLLAGFIGDVIIHIMVDKTKWFAQGLKPYYKSMGKRIVVNYFISGLAGGIACIIALLLGQLFYYIFEYFNNSSSL